MEIKINYVKTDHLPGSFIWYFGGWSHSQDESLDGENGMWKDHGKHRNTQ